MFLGGFDTLGQLVEVCTGDLLAQMVSLAQVLKPNPQ